MDPVSRLCTIDAVFILAKNLTTSTSQISYEVISAIEKVGEEIPRAVSSLSCLFLHESVTLCKTLSVIESLVECSSYWDIICSSCLPSFYAILTPEIHLEVETIDSVFIVTRLLVILQKLCFNSSTASVISSQGEVVHALTQLILNGNSIANRQTVVSSRCMNSKNLILPYSGNTIQTLAVLCIDYLSIFDDCRLSLIDCGVCHTLFQCMYDMESSRFYLSSAAPAAPSSDSVEPPTLDDTVEEEMQVAPIEILRKKSIESDKRASSPDNVITTLLIDILYHLSCKSSPAIYQSLFQSSDRPTSPSPAVFSHVLMNCLLSLWHESPEDLSRKILPIVMRCGVGRTNESQTTETVKRKLTEPPWSTLTNTQQIPLFCGIVSFQQPPFDGRQWKMDQPSLTFAQRISCSAILSLVTQFPACKTAIIDLCQEERVKLDSSKTFFSVLESFCLQFEEAALLMAEIFSWDEMHYR
jgi:hypothetical protein